MSYPAREVLVNIIIVLLLFAFFTWALTEGFPLESEYKSPQVSKYLSFLTDLSVVVFRIVYIRPLILKSPCPWINPLLTVSRAPITIGITVNFIFYSFWNSLARLRYLFLFSLSFNLIQWSAETAKFTILECSLFFCWLISGLVVFQRLDDQFVCQNPRAVFCVSFSRADSRLCTYNLFVWTNFKFLHSSLQIQS